MIVRRRGNLIRTSDGRHGMIAEVDRRYNRATVQLGTDGPFLERVSWWDVKAPTEETYEFVTGDPRPSEREHSPYALQHFLDGRVRRFTPPPEPTRPPGHMETSVRFVPRDAPLAVWS